MKTCSMLLNTILILISIIVTSTLLTYCTGITGPITIDERISFPEKLSFGLVLKNTSTKVSCSFYNENLEDEYLSLSLEGKDKDFFSISGNDNPFYIKGGSLVGGGGKAYLKVGFSPTEERDYYAIIKIKSRQNNYEIKLSGTGAYFNISPRMILDFNWTPIGTFTRKSIKIENVTNSEFSIFPQIDGVDKSFFSFDYVPSGSIKKYSSDSILIKFSPDTDTTKGSRLYNAVVYIDGDKRYLLNLRGEGSGASLSNSPLEIIPSDRYLDFGVVDVNSSNEIFINFNSKTDYPIFLWNIRLEGSSNFKIDKTGTETLQPNQTLKIKANFSGNTPGTYFADIKIDYGIDILLKGIIQ